MRSRLRSRSQASSAATPALLAASAARPQVIILANRPLARPPVPTAPVVFLDPDSCNDGGPLDHLILHWLAHCQPPAASGRGEHGV